MQGPVIFPSDVPLQLHLTQCGFVGVCSCDRGPAPSGDGRGLWHAFSLPTSMSAWFLVGLLLLWMDTFFALPFEHSLAGLYEGWNVPSFIAASSGDRMGPGLRLGGLLVVVVAPRRPS